MTTILDFDTSRSMKVGKASSNSSHLLAVSYKGDISEDGGSPGKGWSRRESSDIKPRLGSSLPHPPRPKKHEPSGFPKAKDSGSPEIITQLSLGWPELSLFGAVCFEWCHYFIFKLPIMHPLKIP